MQKTRTPGPLSHGCGSQTPLGASVLVGGPLEGAPRLFLTGAVLAGTILVETVPTTHVRTPSRPYAARPRAGTIQTTPPPAIPHATKIVTCTIRSDPPRRRHRGEPPGACLRYDPGDPPRPDRRHPR